jgi:UDP-4-amino-4,6-dideoxy-N-acetyl-beta-L-altrosamine N-acetyltransferase
LVERRDCRLRPIEERDLPLVLAWRNSDRIRRNMYTDHVISPDEHAAWFRRLRKESPPVFLVFEHAGVPAGAVNISGRDLKDNRCNWGFYIAREDAPKGCGMAMGYLGLEHIFESMNIRKLIGEAFAFNRASVAFHQKLGFVQEGYFVRQRLKNGTYEDVVSFALFREEWQARKDALARACFGEPS